MQQDSQNVNARVQLGYIYLLCGDRRAVTTLEGVVFGSGASRSLLGAAKIYLSLALHQQCGEKGGNRTRSHQLAKEGLSLHKNLQCVWSDIGNGLEEMPLACIQRLRGICDLDLTSTQARQLLELLAQALGRTRVTQALTNYTPQESGQASAPTITPIPHQRMSSSSPSRGSLGSISRASSHGRQTPYKIQRASSHGRQTPTTQHCVSQVVSYPTYSAAQLASSYGRHVITPTTAYTPSTSQPTTPHGKRSFSPARRLGI